MELLLVYTTLPDLAIAREIGTIIITARLAACINVIPGAESMYLWEGTVESSSEVLLLCKTIPPLAEQLCDKLESLHPYDTPCIIKLPQAGIVNQKYADWIKESLQIL